MQLRNWAGPLQAPGLFDIADKRGKYGLVHNVGLGGAVVVSLLRRPEFYKEGGKPDGRDRYALFRFLELNESHSGVAGWGITTLTNVAV